MKEVSLKRRELYIFVILGLFLIIFLQFLLGKVGLVRVSFLVLIALIGLLLLFVNAIRWKLLSYFFFFWLLLEGIFRKWILPEHSTEIFFVKYLLLVGPYLYIFSKGIGISKKYYPFLGLLLAYFLWGLFEAINFRVTTDHRVKILGLITHFWFIPLIFLVPKLLDTKEKILSLFKIIGYISFPIFILGIMQYSSPSTNIINKYAAEEVPVASAGGFVRITGVFAYIAIYTTYLLLSQMIILCLLVIKKLGKFETLFMSVILSLGVVNLFMTGSRAPAFIFIILASLFLLFVFKNRIKKNVLLRFMLVIPIFLFVVIFTDSGQKSLLSLMERTREASSDVVPRLKSMYRLEFLQDAGLVGFGIGTANNGSDRLVDDWGDMPRGFEGEWDRITLELGLIGFVIVMLLRIYIFFYSWRVLKKIKSNELRSIALLVFLHQFLVFFGLSIAFNYFESVIYWSLIGLLISVYMLERNNATQSSGFSPT